MNNKNSIIVASTVIAAGFVICALILTQEPKIDPAVNQTLRSNFISGCIEDNTVNLDFCSCAYDTLIDKLGTEGFIKLSTEYLSTNVMPEEVYPAVINCLPLISK